MKTALELANERDAENQRGPNGEWLQDPREMIDKWNRLVEEAGIDVACRIDASHCMHWG